MSEAYLDTELGSTDEVLDRCNQEAELPQPDHLGDPEKLQEADSSVKELAYPIPEQSEPAIAAEAVTPGLDQSPTDPASDIPLALNPEKFYDLSYVPTLQSLISSIVQEEGPIREDLLVRAVARRHGWQRAGRRIRERVLRCMSNVETHDEGSSRFCWAPNTFANLVPYRGLKDRSARDIARAEIFGLISTLGHLSRSEDPAKDLSLEMGLSRLTEDTRDYLEECIRTFGEGTTAPE